MSLLVLRDYSYYGLRVYQGVLPEPWPAGEYVPVPGAAPVHVPAQTVCLGSEDTPAAYLWHLLLCLREIGRTLKPTGVAWINIGDSFAASPGQRKPTDAYGPKQQTNKGSYVCSTSADGYQAGTLLGIPAQLQLAAIADGWIVRQECIYSKLSPMPESIRGWRHEQARCACLTPNRVINGQQGYASQGHREHPGGGLDQGPATTADPDCPTCQGTGRTSEVVLQRGSWRHTRATESVFMLCKQMQYFSNSEAVREEGGAPDGRKRGPKMYTDGGYHRNGLGSDSLGQVTGGRNPRNILTPRPSALALDHYASFPPSLIEPLIRATTPERICQCGSPWAPVVHQSPPVPRVDSPNAVLPYTAASNHTNGTGRTTLHMMRETTVHGLARTCSCPDGTRWTPGICLDPFAGASTTLLTARALGRNAVGIEASPVYITLSRERLGLQDLDAWLGKSFTTKAEDVSDLPLFGGG